MKPDQTLDNFTDVVRRELNPSIVVSLPALADARGGGGGHGLPSRGNSQLIIRRYGSPLEGIRSIAFLAKGLAWSSVCRLSFGSDIHSRMIFRRVSCSGFMLKILCSKTVGDGSITAAPMDSLLRYGS